MLPETLSRPPSNDPNVEKRYNDLNYANTAGYRVGYEFNMSARPNIIIIGDSDTVLHNDTDYKYYHQLNEMYNVWTICDYRWSNDQIELMFNHAYDLFPDSMYVIQLSLLYRTGLVADGSLTDNNGIGTLDAIIPINRMINKIAKNKIECVFLPAHGMLEEELSIYDLLLSDSTFLNYHEHSDKTADGIDEYNHCGNETNQLIYKMLTEYMDGE